MGRCGPTPPCGAMFPTPPHWPPPSTAAKRSWKARYGWWRPAATAAPAAAPIWPAPARWGRYQAVAEGWADAEAAGRLLSAPVGSLTAAVTRLQAGEAQLKQRLAALQNALAAAYGAAAVPGQPCTVWAEGADGDGLRRIAMAVAAQTGAACCALAPGGQGLAYALAAAPGGDVCPACRALNEAFQGRGGGKPAFCQGSLADGDEGRVRAFLTETF